MKKYDRLTNYIPPDKRKSPDIIYIPYDPADETLVAERKSLIMDFEVNEWVYIDSCRVPDFHRNEYRYFWILSRSSKKE